MHGMDAYVTIAAWKVKAKDASTVTSTTPWLKPKGFPSSKIMKWPTLKDRLKNALKDEKTALEQEKISHEKH